MGTSLHTTESGTKSECVDLCQNTDGCEFYTYDHKDSFCSAYSNCPILDQDCTTCTSGENECPLLLCSVTGGCTGVLVRE